MMELQGFVGSEKVFIKTKFLRETVKNLGFKADEIAKKIQCSSRTVSRFMERGTSLSRDEQFHRLIIFLKYHRREFKETCFYHCKVHGDCLSRSCRACIEEILDKGY